MPAALPALSAAGGRSVNALAIVALVAMATLPVLELVLRTLFKTGLPGSSSYVQNLSLWVGFVGAVIAARDGAHLKLASGAMLDGKQVARAALIIVAAISAAVCGGLSWASVQFTLFEVESPIRLGGWLPTWVIVAVMPAAFAVIAVHFIRDAGGWHDRAMALGALAIFSAVGYLVGQGLDFPIWIAIAGLALAVVSGAPIFVVLGGLALVLFAAEGVTIAAIPIETYRIVVSPAIPTVPLFVLTGYLLAQGDAGRRLVRLFQALFGWLPGGPALVVVLVCALFSTFTGASGVTILALGGMLFPVLVAAGYADRLSLGLVTTSGSIGLLFPPSLAVILYGVVAHVPIPDLFLAGVGPGLVMVTAVCVLGVFMCLSTSAPRQPFDGREAAAAAWQAKWEIGLPVVAVAAIFGGLTSLTEAAAITATYALIAQTLIHRDIDPIRDLPAILLKCVTLVGAIFAILGVAMGLTNFLVDAQIPMKAAAVVQANIESRGLFLVVLNVFLLAVGSMMDIYAATVVVVPLIIPIAEAFGIHPVHLGMIFLVNLELGYLTPPVGMNLLLSAIRFERPILEVCRAVVPFLAVLVAVVLLVTYLPELSLVFL